MPKPLHLIIYFYISIHVVFAQNESNSDLSVYNQVVLSPQDSITKYTKLTVDSYRAGDLKMFKKYCDIVLAIAIANNLEETRIRVLINIAIYYQQTDQYEKSLEAYLEGEKLAQELLNGSDLKILIETNLGNLYNSIGNYDKAIIAMKEVLELSKNNDNPEMFQNVAYSVLGTASLNQNKFAEALEYMQKTKELSIKLNLDHDLIRTMINISECYLKQGRYEDVIENGKKIFERITKEESVESKAFTQITIGAAYIGLEKHTEAQTPLEEAKAIAISGGFLKIKMEAHHYLAQVYESLDDLKNSLEEQKAYTETREKYLQTLSKAQRLKVEKESENKSNIILEQQKSITFLSKEKQLYVFAGIVLLIILMVSSIMYWNRRKKLAEESIQLQEDKALLKNQNKALKDKLNTLAKKNQEQQESLTNSRSGIRKQKKSSISIEEQERYMIRILNYMDQEKPYLDHEIKQSTVATKLEMSAHLFSEVLSVCFQKNFNNFINLYRVDTAKQLIKDPKFGHYKILAIGYEAGFPSKTSFNRVFKNLVGLTPTEYQNKHSDS